MCFAEAFLRQDYGAEHGNASTQTSTSPVVNALNSRWPGVYLSELIIVYSVQQLVQLLCVSSE